MTKPAEEKGRVLTDALSRLDTMRHDKGQTWDLSPNDQRDIAVVLKSHAALREEVERLKQNPEIQKAAALDQYVRFQEMEEQRDAAEARVERLTAAIKDAPHGDVCGLRTRNDDCICWKARALGRKP